MYDVEQAISSIGDYQNMPRNALVDDNVLRMALIGYEQEKAKIEAAIAEVHAQLGTANPAFTVTEGVAPKKRTMSASARKRIALAQRKRWAQARKEKAEQEKPSETKRQFSRAGLKAIQEASRKRWATYRKAEAQKGTAKTAARKVTPKRPAPKKTRKPAVETQATPVSPASALATT